MGNNNEAAIATRQSPPTQWKLPTDADLVIVGNGIAGMSAAVEARRLDSRLPIVLLTQHNHSTIIAPALKHYLLGRVRRADLLAFPAGTEQKVGLHVMRAQVEAIDASKRAVHLAGGYPIRYRFLLLTTGSHAVGLPVELPGRDYDGVIILHRLRDYLDLRRRLPEVEDVVVIGGGIHAAETVMALACLRRPLRIHWLIRGERPLAHLLDANASDLVLAQARAAGVEVACRAEVTQILGHIGVVAGVGTRAGHEIACQLVLACTGMIPATKLAQACSPPLTLQQGIVVNSSLGTSIPGIYAAGDVAALWDPPARAYAPRAQWHAAAALGRLAAQHMLNKKMRSASEVTGARLLVTHLGELALLLAGDPLDTRSECEIRTARTKGGYRRVAVAGDRLVGYLSLGPSLPDVLAIKQIIDTGRSVHRSTLDLLQDNRLIRRPAPRIAWMEGGV